MADSRADNGPEREDRSGDEVVPSDPNEVHEFLRRLWAGAVLHADGTVTDADA